jgi:Restriction endonuclease
MKANSTRDDDIDAGQKDWQQFEMAVADFLRAAGPSAKVTHDHKQVDPDTQSVRQRDVWVVSELCGLFQVRMLVSCKRWATKLNAKDIEHFFGELQGANAHIGAIYSFSGFTKTAVRKANSLGRGRVHCCQLYTNQPAEIPPTLKLLDCFCVAPTTGFALLLHRGQRLDLKTWADLIEIQPEFPELAQQLIRDAQEKAKAEFDLKRGFPSAYLCEFDIPIPGDVNHLKVRLTLGWKIYRGETTAKLLNGTYCLTQDRFVGAQVTPVIDMKGPHPGPGWVLLDTAPQMREDMIIAVLWGGRFNVEQLKQLALSSSVVNPAD